MSKRLLSLDVFRGITMSAMVLVNNPGTWDYIYPPLSHAAWHGCTPTDLIFPFFLFIIGISITFSLSKRKERGDDQKQLILQILKRSAILFFLGLFLNAFPNFDFSTLRIPGVLQRIAIVYLISSILFLKTNLKQQIVISVSLLIGYFIMMTMLPVPGFGLANLQPETNFGAWFDDLILGGHLWKYSIVWDPEGLLGTLPAIVSAMLGVFAGYILRQDKTDSEKTTWLYTTGTVLMFSGYVWDMFFPINKNLWTSSYVLYAGGIAFVVFALCYWVIDIQGHKKWCKPFEVYGLNAITAYFSSQFFAIILFTVTVNSIPETVQGYLVNNYLMEWFSPLNASFVWAISYVMIWYGVLLVMYKKKIYLKV